MNHKDLKVRQASINLAAEVYSLTKTFPADENFGLTSQVRRAAVSIPSNIAEGGEGI
ncbi:four helix bundle protein [Desulfuromonas sp. TF]|uniref:four helix bundle protein n=1 Tax=Desulfuromonas sp. TF TaxID=1232410 RepID=UPI00042A0FDB|nr:four helix bundle protein [Desulfuromonas sp. TF]